MNGWVQYVTDEWCGLSIIDIKIEQGLLLTGGLVLHEQNLIITFSDDVKCVMWWVCTTHAQGYPLGANPMVSSGEARPAVLVEAYPTQETDETCPFIIVHI